MMRHLLCGVMAVAVVAFSAVADDSCILSGDTARAPAEISSPASLTGGFCSWAYELENQVFDVFRFGPRPGFLLFLR